MFFVFTKNTCSQKLETHKTAHQKEFTKYDYKGKRKNI